MGKVNEALENVKGFSVEFKVLQLSEIKRKFGLILKSHSGKNKLTEIVVQKRIYVEVSRYNF